MRTMVTVTEAAQRLGVSRPTIYTAINIGQLKSFKLGNRRMIRLSEIQKIDGEDDRPSALQKKQKK